MIKWMRPSGNEIQTADTLEMREHGKQAGWKRQRRTKEEMKQSRALENGNRFASDQGSSTENTGTGV